MTINELPDKPVWQMEGETFKVPDIQRLEKRKMKSNDFNKLFPCFTKVNVKMQGMLSLHNSFPDKGLCG